MKKVFSALVLTSFFAVLLVPFIASAGTTGWPDCPSQCATVSVQCNCGGVNGDSVTAGNPKYCYNGVRFNADDQAACLAAASGGTTGSSGSITTIPGLISKLKTLSGYIFDGLIVIAGIFLVVAGYFFVTSGGEPEKVNKARQMLINALIGVAIAVAAKGLVALVQNFVQ